MILNFLLSVVCIVAAVFCIKIGAEWWVSVIFFGLALLCLLIALYKLGETSAFSAGEPSQKKKKYPRRVAYCLTLSPEELVAYAKQKNRSLYSFCAREAKDGHSNAYLTTLLWYMIPVDGEISKAERNFYRELQMEHSLERIMSGAPGKREELFEMMKKTIPEMPASVKDDFLCVAAAIVAIGGEVTPQKLAVYKKLASM